MAVLSNSLKDALVVTASGTAVIPFLTGATIQRLADQQTSYLSSKKVTPSHLAAIPAVSDGARASWLCCSVRCAAVLVALPGALHVRHAALLAAGAVQHDCRAVHGLLRDICVAVPAPRDAALQPLCKPPGDCAAVRPLRRRGHGPQVRLLPHHMCWCPGTSQRCK